MNRDNSQRFTDFSGKIQATFKMKQYMKENGGPKGNLQYLRLAAEDDTELLFQWANEALVRKNSFSGEKILYSEHLKWFEKILGQENTKQYIFVYNDSPIGQIRITVSGEYAEISYSICEKERGKGHGKELLDLLKEKVKQDFPHVQRLIAKVKPDNIASQAVFLNKGYVEKYRLYEMELTEK